MKLIGIDVATKNNKVGLSFADYADSQCRLIDAGVAIDSLTVAEQIAPWVLSEDTVLLCMDAPLGWPEAMGRVLTHHHAGGSIGVESNTFFRRKTDQFVKKKLNKQPLDVGADRIARTALMALAILDELRQITGRTIPMGWTLGTVNITSVIEVYPGATLEALGTVSTAYKKSTQKDMRLEIIRRLEKELIIEESKKALVVSNADVLDSVVCVVAGIDFLRGLVYEPTNQTIAEKEGWIWVRDTSMDFHRKYCIDE